MGEIHEVMKYLRIVFALSDLNLFDFSSSTLTRSTEQDCFLTLQATFFAENWDPSHQ